MEKDPPPPPQGLQKQKNANASFITKRERGCLEEGKVENPSIIPVTLEFHQGW